MSDSVTEAVAPAPAPVHAQGRGLGRYLDLARAFFCARFLRQGRPLMTAFNVTFRCNLRCTYCGVDRLEYSELTAEQQKEMLRELRALGGRWVTFSGGEPLLRKDLLDVIDYAVDTLGMHVFLSSNGRFVPKYIDRLAKVDKISISLDGPEDVHDAVRGEGAFQRAVEAIEACRDKGIKVSLTCTLSSLNTGRLDEVIDFARAHRAWVMFQPGTLWLEAVNPEKNPIAPEPAACRAAIDQLIARKKAGAPIANSLPGLRHLRRWPEASPIGPACTAGLLTATIEPDGRYTACGFDGRTYHADLPAPEGTLTQRVQATPPPATCCNECWCAPLVELNLVLNGNLAAAWNLLRMDLLPYPAAKA